MKLYDSKFVYFDWNDNLKGKKGFFADNIYDLKQNVKEMSWYNKISCGNNPNYPFKDENDSSYSFRFCYYDPYYEFRRAYLEGKQIQFKDGNGGWVDVDGEPLFNSGRDVYRIKPETKWHVAISEHSLFRTRNPSEDETVVFSGTEDECIEWFKEHKQFEDIMLAWKQGKTIQYLCRDDWIDVANNIPLWGLNNTYRVKPDECKGCIRYDYCMDRDGKRCKSYCTKIEYVPFDSVQELIDAWDNKYPQSSKRPEGTMPLIWIKCKEKNRVYLITDFLFEKAYNCDVGTEYENLKLTELFNDFTFADGSIIGKVKEDE